MSENIKILEESLERRRIEYENVRAEMEALQVKKSECWQDYEALRKTIKELNIPIKEQEVRTVFLSPVLRIEPYLEVILAGRTDYYKYIKDHNDINVEEVLHILNSTLSGRESYIIERLYDGAKQVEVASELGIEVHVLRRLRGNGQNKLRHPKIGRLLLHLMCHEEI